MRRGAAKRGAPAAVATSHAAIPSLFTSPHAGDGAPDDWTMARQVDYYGTSFYPKHSMPVGRDAVWRAALLDFERSSAFGPHGPGGFWVGELQAGFGTVALNVGATVTAADLEMWTWSALARGARAINYYAWYPMSTGYESGGFGMIGLDGTITERARAAGALARVVDRHARLFMEARPPRAEVAIVYNPLSYMVGGRQRAATLSGPQSEVGSIERDSWLGAYRAWFPANVPVDFVHAGEMTAENLRGYKLVLFPYPIMIPERAAAVLRDFVASGGALVSEARLAWNNERGRASESIPGLGLGEVMGCRETAVQAVPGLRTELVWSEAFAGLAPGTRIPARLYEETLEPAGPRARVVARFASGGTAAVVSGFGKGKTLALGSYVAAGYEVQRDAAAERFFGALLDWAGVARPVAVRGGDVEVRWLEAGARRVVFVFNHSGKEARSEITLRPAAHSASDLVTGRPVALTPAFTVTLAPGGVSVIEVR
jgi:beta-galactosidase